MRSCDCRLQQLPTRQLSHALHSHTTTLTRAPAVPLMGISSAQHQNVQNANSTQPAAQSTTRGTSRNDSAAAVRVCWYYLRRHGAHEPAGWLWPAAAAADSRVHATTPPRVNTAPRKLQALTIHQQARHDDRVHACCLEDVVLWVEQGGRNPGEEAIRQAVGLVLHLGVVAATL